MTTSQYRTGAIEVGRGVYAFIQPNGATDAGFIVDEEGVIVIDTLMTPTLANRLLSEVQRVTSAPIRYVINTHWHGDHTFGNYLFKAPAIMAHDTCREDLIAQEESHRRFLVDLYPEAREELAQVTVMPPNITFPQELTLFLGRHHVEIRYYGRAHTRGDVVVNIPAEGVLFAGDIAFHQYIPNARDGYPSQWVEVAQQVEEIQCDTIVPGHGPLGTRRDLAEMRECLAHIIPQVRQAFDQGLSVEEAQLRLHLGPFASWGRQEDRIPVVVKRLYQEFRGELD